MIEQLLERLDRIEATLAALVQRETVKDWYSTEEAGRLLGKSEYTVREWARQGRIHAKKQLSGRGRFLTWVISHEELVRIQREGLLPAKYGS